MLFIRIDLIYLLLIMHRQSYRVWTITGCLCPVMLLAKGGNAVVYEDAEDATKVLKMFTASQSNEEVTNEVRCFNQYYGAGSAEKIYGDNGDIIGIRMDKNKWRIAFKYFVLAGTG